MIIGIDEVGRGCWAGPLVACAITLPDEITIEGLRDSKKCSLKQREALDLVIREQALQIGIGWVEPAEIDELGLTKAVGLAMQRAIAQLDAENYEIIIDGNINYLNHLPGSTAVINADDSVPAVSAASIVAKVARDDYMKQQSKEFPNYGFEKHVGYGTKLHIEALKKLGVTSLHRKSYKPVQVMMS